jgi:hypothetical protein
MLILSEAKCWSMTDIGTPENFLGMGVRGKGSADVRYNMLKLNPSPVDKLAGTL